ncbi:MAG: hypothetical protein Q7T01_00290 [bacterium]|nr:hypothetical protein [bacterium]
MTIKSIPPTIETFLDALTGAYREVPDIERRIIKAFLACISNRDWDETASQILLVATRAHLERHTIIPQPHPVDFRSSSGLKTLNALAVDLSHPSTTETTEYAARTLRDLFNIRIALRTMHHDFVRLAEQHPLEQPPDQSPRRHIDSLRTIASDGLADITHRTFKFQHTLDAEIFQLLTKHAVALQADASSARPFTDDELRAAGFPFDPDPTAA